MVRPRKFDRDQAVDTVMNEIWRNGFGASSAKALSERLGITRSSFYNAFGTRDKLFVEALKRYFHDVPDRAFWEAGPERPLKPLITATVRTICRIRSADPGGRGCLAVNGIAELCPANEGVGALLEKAMADNRVQVELLMARAVSRGELPGDTDVKAVALAIQNLIIGLNVMSKVVRSEDRLWKAASATLRGLGLLDEGEPDAII